MVSIAPSQYDLPDHATSLLEFKERLDVNLLDQVISCMLQGGGQHQHLAQQLLTRLKEHPDAWTRVDAILEYSSNEQTKYFALQILEGVIKTKWKALPHEQCDGIQKYIVALIIKISSEQPEMEKHRFYLNKLNVILVQIVKQEWPKNWPTFISDIVGASRTNESLCQNNMIILKLLSEEVFDFSSGQMTQAKSRHLKESMCSEFSEIFNLCVYVMDNSSSFGLVEATLQTLLKFLNWIPLGYIFETKLFTTLIYKFLQIPHFRNVTLKCLTEIASINNETYNEQFLLLFTLVTSQLKLLLPLSTNIREAYQSGRDDEQHFIQNLALFFSSFLREHGELLELKAELHNTLLEALHYLVLISEVDETEIFKICLDYWSILAQNLYKLRFRSLGAISGQASGQTGSATSLPGLALYEDILSRIRQVMISRMCKPEEVLIVENEQGEVVREFMKDTDAINMYKTMRETLVYLTHLNFINTEQIMTEKLARQVDGSEWSWKNLNTLCWAIGSISGSMHEEDEKRFLVTVIKELLSLCEMKRGKDNKAIIASNIMYIVGQYPRFLKAHWKFLKTVVNKLFEFMHETHEGVQDMACDTFIKIAQKCRRHFIMVQRGEAESYVEEILHNISGLICDLEPQQVHTFYEAVGYMISSQTDPDSQEKLIVKYMSLPNQIWEGIINRASRDIETLNEAEIIKQLAHILKTNVRACIAIGHAFITQLARIYMDMLNIYKVLSENISLAINANGPSIMKDPIIRSVRTVKKETLKLISSWVSRAEDPQLVRTNFLPPLLSAILLDYNKNVAEAREPEVLSCVTAIVDKLETSVTEDIPQILDSLFECTLEMINKDLEQYPEHRINFFKIFNYLGL
ncbi:Exportin-1-like isoform X2 [Oopsacas minuta]|uniref:Exportin-1 n=1 Tax=Oopsacas minuta TaxID=111878 RepID=A0AAV7K9M6_9METZ|nr:Exportin-1-like isoform X2 [Oopsacas minuta]